MNEQLSIQYSNPQLEHILNEAVIYMCACPAQVAEQLMQLRKLYDYQSGCINEGSLMESVHRRISQSTVIAHAELERCLDEVLIMEGWDMQTLTMPEGLRELRQQSIEQD
jgi:hypothetical protein